MTNMEYLDASQACDVLGVKRNTLYGYVSSGILQSYRRGIHRGALYRRGEVEALLCIRPSKPSLQDGARHPVVRAIPSTMEEQLQAQVAL